MGLKADIQKAFEASVGGNSPEIEELSISLSKAITDYITRQDFHIEEFNAPVLTAVSYTHLTLPTIYSV